MITAALDEEVRGGHLVRVDAGYLRAAGRVFVLRVPDKAPRLIYDPRELNGMLTEASVSYGKVTDLLASVDTTCAVKFDLKSAFRHIGVAEECRKYLGVVWRGECYAWASLPFGLNHAPRIFVEALEQTLAPLRLKVQLVSYMDDIAVAARSLVIALEHAEVVIEALHANNWTLSAKKTFLVPASQLRFLGLLVNFDDRTIRVSVESAAKAYKLALVAQEAVTQRRERLAWPLLRKLLGYLAWFSLAVRPVNLWRRALDLAVADERWTVEAAAQLDFWVKELRTLPTFAYPRFPEPPTVHIVTDSGRAGGAMISTGRGSVEWHLVDLPAELVSSAAREAYCLAEVLELLDRNGVEYRSVVHHGDAQVVAQSLSRWGAKSAELRGVYEKIWSAVKPTTTRPFARFIELNWIRRSTPLLQLVDAVTESAPPPWSAHPAVASALYERFGPWTLDACAHAKSAVAASYTTAAGPETDERLDKFEEFERLATAGFRGRIEAVSWSRENVFALPCPWSTVVRIAEAFSKSDNVSLTLVYRHDPAAWWWPALQYLQHWSRECGVIDFDFPQVAPDGSTPYCQAHLCYLYASKQPYLQRRRRQAQRPPWWVTPCKLLRSGDVHPNPGPPKQRSTFAQALARAVAADRKGGAGRKEAGVRTVQAQPRTTPLNVPRRVEDEQAVPTISLFDGIWIEGDDRVVVRGSAVEYTHFGLHEDVTVGVVTPLADGAFSLTLRSRHASLTLVRAPFGVQRDPTMQLRAYELPAGVGDGERKCRVLTLDEDQRLVSRAAEAAMNALVASFVVVRCSDDTPLGSTLIAFLDGLVVAAMGRQAFQRPTRLGARLAQAKEELSAYVSKRERPSAIFGITRRIRHVMEFMGLEDSPGTEEALSVVSALYCQVRLHGHPKLAEKRVGAARLSSELSHLAKIARDAGLPVQPGISSLVSETLRIGGLRDKPEHSVKLPIHLVDLIRVQPERASADWTVWCCLVLQSLFCLRPGAARELSREQLTPVNGGLVLVWDRRTKTLRGKRGDGCDVIRAPRISAARHTLLSVVMDDLPKQGRLFPAMSRSAANDFIRRKFEAHRNFKLGSHGVRVGTETELHELRVPLDLQNQFGWWKRERVSTATYYSGTSLAAMMVITSQLGETRFTHFHPGYYVPNRSKPLPNWEALFAAEAEVLVPRDWQEAASSSSESSDEGSR